MISLFITLSQKSDNLILRYITLNPLFFTYKTATVYSFNTNYHSTMDYDE